MAEESQARVPCPKCSAKLPWRAEYAGRVATCKACSTKLRMPKSPSEPPQPVRKRSAKQGAAAANRQDDSDGDDPFAFLDDEETDAQSLASAPRPPGRGNRRKRRGQSSSGGGSIKCPGCGANCAPTESSCPACDHSLSPEVLAANQSKKNRQPKERMLPEIYILGVGFEKILIALIVLGVVGFFTIPPLLNKIEEMNAPQPFYKVINVGGYHRVEVFDPSGQFVNAAEVIDIGVVEFQNGGKFHGVIEGQPSEGPEIAEDGPFSGPLYKLTMDPNIVMEFTGVGPLLRVRSLKYDGKSLRQKYDSGQLSQ